MLLVFCLLMPALSGRARAQEGKYHSAGELTGIGLGSVAMFGAGQLVKRSAEDKGPRWVDPPGFDISVTRFFGGEPKPGKRNFLDDNFGSGVTVAAAAILIAATDASYPQYKESKDILQTQYLYFSGLLVNKGTTDLFKGLVRRQRPINYLAPEIAAERTPPVQPADHESFFSGHASSAFYAMTFLNHRVLAAMRQEMSSGNYRNWRWLPSTINYGWATFVALSRMQAYRHYLTDVLVGAAVGFVVGSLFYELSDDIRPASDSEDGGSPLYLEFRFSF
jgi:hypothetical protein